MAVTEISPGNGENTPSTEIEFAPEEKFALDLTGKIADAVLPVYGIKQKDVPIGTRSHDFQYALDDVAENKIKDVFENDWKYRQGVGIEKLSAYITEDQGFVDPGGELDYIYMIDPVDGSRPAMSGTEQATVTMVAVKGDKKDAKFSDIEFGITHFIKEGITLFVRRGEGVFQKDENGKIKRIKPRTNPPINLKDCSCGTESYSFNKMYTGIVGDPLARAVGYEMSAPSGSYLVAALVRGHNEITADFRDRLVRDYPDHLEIKYNQITSKGGSPMDIAASVLMIQELGGIVTDAYGNSLNDKSLWRFDSDGNWDTDNQISTVAAITPQLHRQVMAKINEGFHNLDEFLNR